VDSISSDVRVMSGGLQPNLALDHKPLFPEFGPYRLCQHERTFSPAYGEQSVIERHCARNQGCIGQRRRTARNTVVWRATQNKNANSYIIEIAV